MTRNELIEIVNGEITGSGSLPYSVPEKESNRIIDQSLNWFFQNYGPATETQYYVIEQKWFSSDEFTKTRALLLPDCVVSVFEVKEISGGGRLGTIDRDFADNRLIASELFLSPFQSDDLVLRTAQYSYWDLTQAFILERISYDYNRNTHRLKILGRDPKKDVFLQTCAKIEENRLYDDWFFQRWVTAQSKMSLARILGTFKFNLPGGIEVDASAMKDEGKEELEEIKKRIDDENSPDWFYIFHSFVPFVIALSALSLLS